MDLTPVTLESANVRLEPLSEEQHLEALCRVGLDPDLWHLGLVRISSPADMRSYIRSALAAQAAGTALPFATIERQTGNTVGSTRFMNIDAANRRVEIGSTWIADPWKRTAINTEAKYLMLRHAFETWGCARVELKTDALNQRSRNAIQRIGGIEEGVLRQHMLTWSGRFRDTVYYSILESEWPSVKAKLLTRASVFGVSL